jgi:SAM-dependent methyltransferase
MSPSQLARFHPESEFGGFTDMDGGIVFYARAQELLPPDGVALDIGCGRGAKTEDPVRIRRELATLRGRCRHVLGIDVDPGAATNPLIDEFREIVDGQPWPVESSSIDLAIADFVLEHIAEPDAFLAEAARVLKPGGHLGIRTINANSYLGIASRLVPIALHRRTLSRLQPDRAAEDVFPTVYRCNTVRKLRRGLERQGLHAVVYGLEAEPVYLSFSAPTYAAGLLHRRLAPGFMRVGLIGWARRI